MGGKDTRWPVLMAASKWARVGGGKRESHSSVALGTWGSGQEALPCSHSASLFLLGSSLLS